jgi:tRNA G18 (ribose-2'-O)-methylase SpoU
VRTETITDPEDPRLADYRALTDIELRTRFEEPHGLFVAEGELVLRRAARAGYQVRSVLLDAKRVDQVADLDVGDAPVYTAGQDLLEKLTGFHVHRGMLASFRRRELPSVSSVLAGARRVVILEAINNHTNVGAIFRGAAALGMDAVLLSPTCADPLYRRSVRVSMGEVFAVPYARLEPWPAGLEMVREAGFSVLAMSLAEGARPIQDLSDERRRRPALMLGAEGSGLSPAALRLVDENVIIPMQRGVDSLNVAAAAAVAFWELSRPASA